MSVTARTYGNCAHHTAHHTAHQDNLRRTLEKGTARKRQSLKGILQL